MSYEKINLSLLMLTVSLILLYPVWEIPPIHSGLIFQAHVNIGCVHMNLKEIEYWGSSFQALIQVLSTPWKT